MGIVGAAINLLMFLLVLPELKGQGFGVTSNGETNMETSMVLLSFDLFEFLHDSPSAEP